MTTHLPEALRLADALMEPVVLDKHAMQAAAELRRLLSEALRIEALHAQAQRELFDAKAANQELLEALQAVKDWDVSNLTLDIPLEIRKKMQAAIAKHGGAA